MKFTNFNSFLQRGQAYFPLIQHIEDRVLLEQCSPSEQIRIVEICLAASIFGETEDKLRLLELADSLLQSQSQLLQSQMQPESQLLQPRLKFLGASVQLRRMKLSFLRGNLLQDIDWSILPGPRGNAQLAEFRVLQSQQFLEQSWFQKAWEVLSWSPLNAAQPSRLEVIGSSEIDYMKGKLLRFQGNFKHARQTFEPIAYEFPPTATTFKSRLQLLSTYSELGLWDKGKTLLKEIIPTTVQQRRILVLGEAEFYMSRGLDFYSRNLPEAKNDLDFAQGLYSDLVQLYDGIPRGNKTMRRNFFRVSFGYAITHHIERRTGSAFSQLRALTYWQLAHRASSECFVNSEGFPNAICLLAIADLEACRLDTYEANFRQAETVWSKGRVLGLNDRFFFCSLGTRWANIIFKWWKERDPHAVDLFI